MKKVQQRLERQRSVVCSCMRGDSRDALKADDRKLVFQVEYARVLSHCMYI